MRPWRLAGPASGTKLHAPVTPSRTSMASPTAQMCGSLVCKYSLTRMPPRARSRDLHLLRDPLPGAHQGQAQQRRRASLTASQHDDRSAGGFGCLLAARMPRRDHSDEVRRHWHAIPRAATQPFPGRAAPSPVAWLPRASRPARGAAVVRPFRVRCTRRLPRRRGSAGNLSIQAMICSTSGTLRTEKWLGRSMPGMDGISGDAPVERISAS